MKLREYRLSLAQDQEDTSSCFTSTKNSNCNFFLADMISIAYKAILPRKFKLGGTHEIKAT